MPDIKHQQGRLGDFGWEGARFIFWKDREMLLKSFLGSHERYGARGNHWKRMKAIVV